MKRYFLLKAYGALALAGLIAGLNPAVSVAQSASQTATLSLSPASRSIAVGDEFSVEIILDTGGNAVDGVDIHYLNYKPQYLEVQDADAGLAGVQIKPGSLFPSTMTNKVDTVAGKIDFSQITRAGGKYTGSGVLATITFKVVGVDTPDVHFDFSAGNTRDSNVASGGVDVLASATGARFSNTGGASQTPGAGGGAYNAPLATPSPTPSPTPGSGITGPTVPTGETELGVIVKDSQGRSCLSPRFRNPLYPGVQGQIVKILQKFLNSQGHNLAAAGPGAPGQETEFYGNITVGGVQKFQCAQGVVCSGSQNESGYGLVGPRTRAKLDEVVISSNYLDCAYGASFAGAFDRNLTVGSRGADVMRLQQVLNQRGFVIASSGAGSPGQETDYFGTLTQAALKKYQENYASEVLAPVGLFSGTGFFGPSTRNHLNQLLGQ
jgi:peptidoglycan hydrolase-like protein with peptidoglycan-binding domain